jgi:hypothetical protein
LKTLFRDDQTRWFEGEMSVIFWVDPLFGFSLSGLIMASNSSRDCGAACNNSWVGKEALGVASHFSADGAAMIPRCLIGKKEDWEILLPNVSDRVCLCFSANRIPMYEAIFREVGFRLPFSSFQVRVFELLCRFLRLPDTKDLFFTIFAIQRGLDKDGSFNWVSFRQRKALFEVFNSEALKFQERFFNSEGIINVQLLNVPLVSHS